eukprot:6175955-Pleurochrysis_carterae.AAC.4
MRRMHTHNAGDLTSKVICAFLLQQGVRLTTISPHVPRQNGAYECQWRTMARDMRAKLVTSKLAVSYWWYHLKSSSDVSSLLPLRDVQSESPWF